MQQNRREFIRSSSSFTAAIAGFSPFPALISNAQEIQETKKAYQSPYRLNFRHPVEELSVGFNTHPWKSHELQSEIPHGEWYSKEVRRKLGAWGPRARQYPAAPEMHRRTTRWLQDRVILTASRWIGTPYQHHHIPDWNPPGDWPWLKVAYGRNSKGIDCSNFSSFYYNYGLGIKLDTGIKTQAERTKVRGPGGHGILELSRIERTSYDELVQKLQPADLLYIRNNSGQIAHVIMYLGQIGESPDNTPLIIDSTGGGHVDSNGNKIPIGIHIRPFRRNSWYASSFAHAHRIIRSKVEIQDGTVPEAEEGGAEDITDV